MAGLCLLLASLGGIGHIKRMSAAPPFDRVEVEPGRYLHTLCEGPKGAPFILYDAGAFGIYTDGWWIKEALKADHRICLYDRAGMGWSDPVPEGIAPSPDWHVEEMRRLRAALGEAGPLILIGHSMAGLRLHAYANLYPEDLAGLIFIDAARPQSLAGSRIERLFPWILRAMSVGKGLARIGIMGGISSLLPDELDLPTQQKADKRRSISAVSHHGASKAEIVAALGTAPNAAWLQGEGASTRPVAVFSNSENGGANAPVAKRARHQAGYGEIMALPEESHVSLLNKNNAEKVAAQLRAMLAHQPQTDNYAPR